MLKLTDMGNVEFSGISILVVPPEGEHITPERMLNFLKQHASHGFISEKQRRLTQFCKERMCFLTPSLLCECANHIEYRIHNVERSSVRVMLVSPTVLSSENIATIVPDDITQFIKEPPDMAFTEHIKNTPRKKGSIVRILNCLSQHGFSFVIEKVSFKLKLKKALVTDTVIEAGETKYWTMLWYPTFFSDVFIRDRKDKRAKTLMAPVTGAFVFLRKPSHYLSHSLEDEQPALLEVARYVSPTASIA